MKAILHIGQQKTGSTSLQYFWEKNRSALKARGVLYPKSMGKNKQIRIFSEHEQLGDAGSSLMRSFQRELDQSGAETVLFSEENLYVCKPHIKAYVRDFLLHHFSEIEIVVYLRRQEEHIPSHYQQAVKGRVGLPLDRWIKKMVRIKNQYYKYDQVLDTWRALFPTASIRVVPFAVVREQSLYDHSLSYLGIDGGGLDMDVPSLNESWDRRSIELFRNVNALAKERPELISEEMRVDIRRYIVEDLDQHKGDKIILSQEQLDVIYEATTESNRRLISTYDVDERYHSYFMEQQQAKPMGEAIKTQDLFYILLSYLKRRRRL